MTPDPTRSTPGPAVTRRSFLEMLGLIGGSTLAYHSMTALGLAAASPQSPRPQLQGRGDGKKVLILGAGLAGMASAYELQKVGYDVQILEYQDRAGGRAWTLRGGDTYTELGGATQRVTFQRGNYFNPGPWRVPYHHHAFLDYAREFGVPLEPFIQNSDQAYVHRDGANPARLRMREVRADFHGHVAELLSKSLSSGALDQPLTGEDRERLLDALRTWGALDRNGRYVEGFISANHRGYDVSPGDRLQAGEPSTPTSLSFLLQHGFWEDIVPALTYDHQNTIFQPVGGMDALAQAFARRVNRFITFQADVKSLTATDSGVQVTYTDRQSGADRQVSADYCICALPLSVLSQKEVNVDDELKRAVREVPYAPSFKAGLEMKRRFWEEDDRIYGGVTYTNLPIQLISYPSGGLNRDRSGVLLAAYQFGAYATKYSGMTPQARLDLVRRDVQAIHPQANAEYRSGVSVGWHRVPWALGCYGMYTDEGRKTTYEVISRRHGRVMLAGEHVSYWSGWQEGALLSAISAVQGIHEAARA